MMMEHGTTAPVTFPKGSPLPRIGTESITKRPGLATFFRAAAGSCRPRGISAESAFLQ